MTRKLFYEDAYLRKFDALVTTCTKVEDVFQVTLDATAFYPEGGGQPGDTGSLGGVRVLDTQEQNGEVVHLCDGKLTPGEMVTGEIDWDRRFDFMQQHSGEHILSGLVCCSLGLHNVGFHMGADVVTIDFSGEVTEQQLQDFERQANEIIWRDVPVRELYPDEQALQTLDFRSKKELHGWVRLIEIPGADLCACCGVHVARTGAVGLIKVLSVQHFRQGVRVELLCGRRAYDYVNLNAAANRAVSQLLSAKLPDTPGAVQRLLEERDALSYRLVGLERARFAGIAQAHAGQSPALVFEPDLSADGVRRLCTALQETAAGVCAVSSGTEEEGYHYAVARLAPETVREMNAALSGRGGGKPGFAQGSLRARRAEIEAWFRR